MTNFTAAPKDPMRFRGFKIEQFEDGKFGIKISKDYMYAVDESIDKIKTVINELIDRWEEQEALAAMAENKK